MIPFNNLQEQYRAVRQPIDDAVRGVLDSGWYVMGEQLKAFEAEFARYIGVNYCVGVASGTEAIALSLMALGVGSGDEVITSNVTAFPTISGILQAGAQPVVVDINYHDGLIDCAAIESAITPRTRAIVAVHLYGQCCDMDALLSIANKRGLSLIEDAAQAAGATYRGKKAGSFGECSAFSFYPTKNLGAYGDGGAVTTSSGQLHDKLLMLRNYGQRDRYHHEGAGLNSRLDELQAAILRVKLGRLDAWNRRRGEIAAYYRLHLTCLGCLEEHALGTSNNHLFVVQHEAPERCMRHMTLQGVETLIHYPVPVNRHSAFSWQKHDSFPHSDRFTRTIFSLPLYPELTEENVQQIVEAANGC